MIITEMQVFSKYKHNKLINLNIIVVKDTWYKVGSRTWSSGSSGRAGPRSALQTGLRVSGEDGEGGGRAREGREPAGAPA